jgi:hypothetical protein
MILWTLVPVLFSFKYTQHPRYPLRVTEIPEMPIPSASFALRLRALNASLSPRVRGSFSFPCSVVQEMQRLDSFSSCMCLSIRLTFICQTVSRLNHSLPPDHPQSDLKAIAVGKGCERGEDDDGQSGFHGRGGQQVGSWNHSGSVASV